MIKSSDLPMYEPEKRGPLGVQAPNSKPLGKEHLAENNKKKEPTPAAPCVQNECDPKPQSALAERTNSPVVVSTAALLGKQPSVAKKDLSRAESIGTVEVSFCTESDGLLGVSSFPDLTWELKMQKRLAPNILPLLKDTAFAITSRDAFSVVNLRKEVANLLEFHGRFMTLKSEQLCSRICEHAVARVEEYEVGRRSFGDDSPRARNRAVDALNLAIMVVGRECAWNELQDDLTELIRSVGVPNPKLTLKLRKAVGKEFAVELSRGFRENSLTVDKLESAFRMGLKAIPELKTPSDKMMVKVRESIKGIVKSLSRFTPVTGGSK